MHIVSKNARDGYVKRGATVAPMSTDERDTLLRLLAEMDAAEANWRKAGERLQRAVYRNSFRFNRAIADAMNGELRSLVSLINATPKSREEVNAALATCGIAPNDLQALCGQPALIRAVTLALYPEGKL